MVIKLVTKTITSRLKQIQSDIIDPEQSAFVRGRLITDNALLEMECFHWVMKKKMGKKGTMALKLDMSKAYDKMEWRFMEGVLNLMGSPVSLVNLIMKCISSVSYQFLLNDQTSRKFYPGRGLCQGDPLSPYSFVMCAYVLSGKLKMGTYKNQIHGIQVFRRAPKISHLFFDDDCLLFSKANTDEADKILEILN